MTSLMTTAVSPLRIRLADLVGKTDYTDWILTDEEDMGHAGEHDRILNRFRETLSEWVTRKPWPDAYVGSDLFMGWIPKEPTARISPDVYLLDFHPDPLPDSLQTWRPGHRPPVFALEVVSKDKRKDYVFGPEKYCALGAQELVVFDPKQETSRERYLIQQWHRTADGDFVRVYTGDGPIYSPQLEAWLVALRTDGRLEFRVSEDQAGQHVMPVRAELSHELRAAQTRIRTAHAETQAAQAEAQAAQARIRELEAKLRLSEKK